MVFSSYWSSLYKHSSKKKSKPYLHFDKSLNVFSWANYMKQLNIQCKDKRSAR